GVAARPSRRGRITAPWPSCSSTWARASSSAFSRSRAAMGSTSLISRLCLYGADSTVHGRQSAELALEGVDNRPVVDNPRRTSVRGVHGHAGVSPAFLRDGELLADAHADPPGLDAFGPRLIPASAH